MGSRRLRRTAEAAQTSTNVNDTKRPLINPVTRNRCYTEIGVLLRTAKHPRLPNLQVTAGCFSGQHARRHDWHHSHNNGCSGRTPGAALGSTSSARWRGLTRRRDGHLWRGSVVEPGGELRRGRAPVGVRLVDRPLVALGEEHHEHRGDAERGEPGARAGGGRASPADEAGREHDREA